MRSRAHCSIFFRIPIIKYFIQKQFGRIVTHEVETQNEQVLAQIRQQFKNVSDILTCSSGGDEDTKEKRNFLPGFGIEPDGSRSHRKN